MLGRGDGRLVAAVVYQRCRAESRAIAGDPRRATSAGFRGGVPTTLHTSARQRRGSRPATAVDALKPTSGGSRRAFPRGRNGQLRRQFGHDAADSRGVRRDSRNLRRPARGPVRTGDRAGVHDQCAGRASVPHVGRVTGGVARSRGGGPACDVSPRGDGLASYSPRRPPSRRGRRRGTPWSLPGSASRLYPQRSPSGPRPRGQSQRRRRRRGDAVRVPAGMKPLRSR